MRGFCNTTMDAGDPVTLHTHENGYALVCPYDGRDFSGILLNNTFNAHLTKTMRDPIGVQVGSLVNVAGPGCEVVLPIQGSTGQCIRPKKDGTWKVTNKRKRRSVGVILSGGENFCKVRLI